LSAAELAKIEAVASSIKIEGARLPEGLLKLSYR
jgi:hypothetical protein